MSRLAPRASAATFGPARAALDPELPPNNFRRSEVGLAHKQRTDRRGRNRLKHLEPLNVRSPRVASVATIIPDAAPQETTGIVGHEQQRAFRPVFAPLGPQNHNVPSGKLYRCRDLRRLGTRAFSGRERRDLDHRAGFQAVDIVARIRGRRRQITQRPGQLSRSASACAA